MIDLTMKPSIFKNIIDNTPKETKEELDEKAKKNRSKIKLMYITKPVCEYCNIYLRAERKPYNFRCRYCFTDYEICPASKKKGIRKDGKLYVYWKKVTK